MPTAALEGEELGHDAVPDMLVVSVSWTDYVSHAFGPTSREMLDTLRRADRQLRDFIAVLDGKLGRDDYAAHAVPRLRARQAGRRPRTLSRKG